MNYVKLRKRAIGFSAVFLVGWILFEPIRWFVFIKTKQVTNATMVSNPIFEMLSDNLDDYHYELPLERQKQYLVYEYETAKGELFKDSVFYHDYSSPDISNSFIGFYQSWKPGDMVQLGYLPIDPHFNVPELLVKERGQMLIKRLYQNLIMAGLVILFSCMWIFQRQK